MKLFLAGDSHGVSGTIKKYLRQADESECDYLFVLGDFGYWEHTYDGVEYLDQVNHYASQMAMPVYFLDGNHDKTSLLLRLYHEQDDEGFIRVRENVLYSPRGHRWTWDGVRFASFGGAYSVDKDWRLHQEKKKAEKIFEQNTYRPKGRQVSTDTSGTLWFPEEEMSDIDMDEFLKDTTPVDVMLTHDKPRGANPEWNRKDFPECWPNQDRLQRAVMALQPKLLFHGHLHYDYEQDIRCGDDDKFTNVVGLAADGEKNSGYILDTGKLT